MPLLRPSGPSNRLDAPSRRSPWRPVEVELSEMYVPGSPPQDTLMVGDSISISTAKLMLNVHHHTYTRIYVCIFLFPKQKSLFQNIVTIFDFIVDMM